MGLFSSLWRAGRPGESWQANDKQGYYRDDSGNPVYYGYSKPGDAAKTYRKMVRQIGSDPQKYLRRRRQTWRRKSYWVAFFLFPVLPILATLGAGLGGGLVAGVLFFWPAVICFWWGFR